MQSLKTRNLLIPHNARSAKYAQIPPFGYAAATRDVEWGGPQISRIQKVAKAPKPD